MPVQLRDYQQRCVDTIIKKARDGIRRQIVVLATGTGKTVIFSHLPTLVRDKGKKTLIIAHREELLDQAKEKLLFVDATLKIAIEQGDRRAKDEFPNNDYDVLIASVQTIGRENSKRIKQFDPNEFGLIVIDECHHSTASTYTNVLRYFDMVKGEVKEKHGRILLGVTATPDRADHIGLDTVFDKMTFTYPLRQAIEDGFLVDIKAHDVKTASDLSGVHTRMGDYVGKELSEALNNPERNRLIVESYNEIAPGSKAICFAVDVEHTKELTRVFNSAGIPAEYIIGDTESEERKETFQRFKDGTTRILVNCAVLTEGYDEPSIETVLMTRPTKSSVLFSQMLGRGTRLHDGKEHLTLIDFVDNAAQAASVYGLFNIPKDIKTGKQGKLLLEFAEKVEKLLEENPGFDVTTITDWSDENIEKVIKEISIFEQAKLPPLVQQHSRYAWEAYMDGYRVNFPHSKDDVDRECVTMVPDMLGLWQVTHTILIPSVPSFQNGFRRWIKHKETDIGTFRDIGNAFQAADNWIADNKSEHSNMLSQNSKWRKDAPSEAQINLMMKFNIPMPPNLTKGQASVLIGKKLNEKRMGRG